MEVQQDNRKPKGGAFDQRSALHSLESLEAASNNFGSSDSSIPIFDTNQMHVLVPALPTQVGTVHGGGPS
jgi:hypothetical protein